MKTSIFVFAAMLLSTEAITLKGIDNKSLK